MFKAAGVSARVVNAQGDPQKQKTQADQCLANGAKVGVLFAAGSAGVEVTAEELRGSAAATVDWFVRNQHADGTWLYLYDERDDSTSSEYNDVRHAGVTMGLYQAAAAGFP